MPKKVTVIIPCYNEEATIEELLARVEKADFGLWSKEILVVDDGSSDRSRALLNKYRSNPQYTIIFHEKNGGKGEAERTAIRYAKGDYLVLQDADLEYNPAEIKKLLDVVDTTGAQVVFGSRNYYTSWHRLRTYFGISIGVWASTQFVNILYGTRLTDAWTCYKLFSQEVARKAHFIGGGFEADYLFIGEVAVNGYTISEVPITHTPRSVQEGKKIRYKDGIRSMLLLLLHRLSHLRPQAVYCAKDVATYLNAEYPKDDDGRTLALTNAQEFKEEHGRGVNWLKSFLKQFPFLYYAVWHTFCPVLMLVNGPRRVFRYAPNTGLIVDVGSGPQRLGEEFVNVDVMPFAEVDVVADAHALPFKDEVVDVVVSESMLEHVADAPAAAHEMVRVLKKGGVLYVSIPFLHPYHASPDDYNRYTISGLRHLFSGLEVLESGVRSGPWSAFLMFLAYWLGVVFSFGSAKAAPFLAHVFMLILGPFKFLDFLFIYLPGAEAVAAHIYVIGRKK